MGKLMSAALLMLVGCGVEAPQTKAEPGAQELQFRAPAAMRGHVFAAIPREGMPRRIREHVNVDVDVKGVLGAEGKALTVVVGQAGCGFLVNAKGTATVLNGVAHVSLGGLPADSEVGVLLGFDTDGDGKCSEADTMWSGTLVTQQSDLTLALDLSTLEAGPNWMCFALDEPPTE